MRGAIGLVLALGCSEHGSRPPFDAASSITCGTELCRPDQLCGTITAGMTCDTNPDAGIGPFDVIAQHCMNVPAACANGPLSCECIVGCPSPSGGRPCLSVTDRSVSCGCF